MLLDRERLIIQCHHERWDGRGYPLGLKGPDIPYLARILAVVDSFDAMTNDRPYRPAMSKEEAVKELVRNKNSQFDPDIVDAYIKIL
jgi:HD-GYP domain-containing protein (c-di-GMP phosphodiesterase class II)